MAVRLRETTVAEICDVFDGPHATPTKTQAGPIFLGITSLTKGRIDLTGGEHISEEDFAKWTRRVTPRPGDVVFSYETKLGEAAIIPDGLRCCLGRRMALMRPDPDKVDSRFLLYYYLGPEFQEVIRERTIHGSTVERLALIEFPKFPLRLPPLAEQKAVAETLGALDDKIESNRRTSRALERVARALFRAWFVDFEPVKAKAAGAREFPGMPPETFAALPSRFVPSELGPVPEGWAVRPLDAVVEVNPSRRLAKGVLASYLDMGQMPMDGHAPASWVKREAGSGARFMNGDTLVARITPCLENGKTAFVDFLADGEVAWGSTEYIVLRPKPPIPDLYAYLLARTPEFRAFAIRNMSGTSGRQRVPFTTMNKFNVAIGSEAVMSAFGEAVAPLFARSSAGVSESRRLATLRDYLLPKLLSGVVRAPEMQEVGHGG